MTSDKCQLSGCGKTRDDHLGMAHEFSVDGQLRKASESVQMRQSSFGSDPVLRLALINAGVITPEDLTKADAILQASGGGGVIAHTG